MRERIMRLVIFFDLPSVTARDRRTYRLFRKFLIKEGFIMVQESVYSKLALNLASAQGLKERVSRVSPQQGSVKALIITERQYACIEELSVDNQGSYLATTDRLVIF